MDTARPHLVPPRIPVKPFNIFEALKGAPFIHRLDATKPNAWDHVSTVIVRIDHPEHPAYAVYCGEWLVYDLTRGELDDMTNELLLVDSQRAEAAKEAARG
jgi:hypothetical protein